MSVTTRVPPDLAWADEREIEALMTENPNTGYPNMDRVMTEIEIGIRAAEANILRNADDDPPVLYPSTYRPKPWED